MRTKILAHKQLVLFTILLPVSLIAIEAPIVLLFSPKESLPYIFMAIQYMAIWLICFLIYNRAYRVITIDHKKIKCRRTEIVWEEIERIEIKEVKLLEYSLIPTITLSSYAYVFSKDKVIQISISKSNIEKLHYFSCNKSECVLNLTKYDI